jgi:protein-disulfide isomerase
MRRYLAFVIVTAVALATLVTGAILYRAKRLPALTIPGNSALGKVDADSIHVLGARDAPVTLMEFGDFQCPPCANLAEPINQIERDYRSRVRVVFRHLPLANHQHAREAALASEAAGLQGRFWEMHDLLYREQSVWGSAPDVGYCSARMPECSVWTSISSKRIWRATKPKRGLDLMRGKR